MSATTAPASPSVALRLGRGLLTGVAAVLYAAGWTVGVVWLVTSWPVLAMLVGFRDAAGRRR